MKHIIGKKSCSFIGNLEMSFDETLETQNKIDNLLEDLIIKKNCKHFILSNLKGFNGVAYKQLYGHQQKHPEITLGNVFDYIDYPIGNIPFSVKLEFIYRVLIDQSDLVVFDLKKKSEEAVFSAYEYAQSKKKEIIILQ